MIEHFELGLPVRPKFRRAVEAYLTHVASLGKKTIKKHKLAAPFMRELRM